MPWARRDVEGWSKGEWYGNVMLDIGNPPNVVLEIGVCYLCMRWKIGVVELVTRATYDIYSLHSSEKQLGRTSRKKALHIETEAF